MRVDNETLKELEFESVLEILKSKAFSDYGRAYFDSPKFFDDPFRIYDQVNEVIPKIQDISSIFYRVENLTKVLKSVLEGKILESKQIFDFSNLFKISKKLSGILEDTQTLGKLSKMLNPPKGFIEKCERTFNLDGTIRDNATPTLFRIKRELKAIDRNINEKVRKLLFDGVNKGYITDALVVQRHDRYVLPVNAAKHTMVRGIVHGQSSSGVTYYVEPEELIQLNDALAIYRSKEAVEISRILAALTKMIYDNSQKISDLMRALGEFDALCARARYAIQNGCIFPNIRKDGALRIISGRNPLIAVEKVVPINFELGSEDHVIILSGPNTGGKTATLKIIGLFVLMTTMGIPIPAMSGTEISVFDSLFSDIGDNQSVRDELSTFSARVMREDRIYKSANERTLVLIDEIGDGTEPAEGTAFAKSMIELLMERGVRAVVTTHLPGLKTLAFTNKGIRNASVGFDIGTMTPTYRIHMDMPGRSHAFEMVKKLEVSADLIREFAKNRTVSLSKTDLLVEELQTKIHEYEEKSEELKKKEEELLKKERDFWKKFEKLKENRLEDLSNEVKELSTNLTEVKKELEKAIHTVRSSSDLSELKRQDKKIAALKERINDFAISRSHSVKKIGMGSHVKIAGTDAQGIVIGEEKDKIIVEVGNVQIKIVPERVKLIEESGSLSLIQKTAKQIDYVMSEKNSGRIDVRGMTVEDALPNVEEFVDRVLQSNSIGYVIHGKGTGRLANGIWAFLRSKRVPFRIGRKGEGGTGVTVIGVEK